MSAFMCSDKHVSAIVSFAVNKRMTFNTKGGPVLDARVDAKKIAKILFQQNLDSVNCRYPSHDNGSVSDYWYKFTIEPFSAIQIIKLCQSLQYQSCETDGYKSTDAYAIVKGIADQAIYSIPGYAEAKWAIN